MDQRDVAQAPNLRHAFLGLRFPKLHIGQIAPSGLSHQHLPLRTGADKQKQDIWLIRKFFCGVQNVNQPVRHAVRAQIPDHELAADPPFLCQHRVPGPRGVSGYIHTVQDHVNLLRVNPAGHQIVFERLGKRCNRGRAPVEEKLEPFHHRQK